MRKEFDLIGQTELPENVLYGIHTLRAIENFPDKTPFHLEWYRAIGFVKSASYLTYRDFKSGVLKKYNISEIPISFFEDFIIETLIESAEEVSEGKYFDSFRVPAVQGGAGTSININVNEIITNISLIKIGEKPGNYEIIDPFVHANVYQSTNDVIPTSLRVAAMFLLLDLEQSVNKLRFKTEELERMHRNKIRIAYTQMQEAVPTSYGKLFGAYNEAFSRDWWRISKCFERIKTVNLGGGAVGTALAVPRFFVHEVVRNLQKITKLPITGSENLSDATSNIDSQVEVHAILKAHAVNLEKIVSDLRLLASDVCGSREIELPARQTGSSIMPGKINPVIPEFVISVCHKIYANDVLISSLAAQGCLELNAYLPTIGNALLESIKLLIAADNTLTSNLFDGIKINSEITESRIYESPVITTALVPYLGYGKCSEIAKYMKNNKISVYKANEDLKFMEDSKLKKILSVDNLLKSGFSVSDLI
jgi:aspartate ammonia-lyase